VFLEFGTTDSAQKNTKENRYYIVIYSNWRSCITIPIKGICPIDKSIYKRA